MASIVGLALAGSIASQTLPAIAAPTADEKQRAEALFQEAKTLMEKGLYDDACPKLAQAQQLDPGGGVLLALALCHEGEGRGATALAEFREALELAKKAGRGDREKMANDHLGRLETNVSRAIVTLPEGAIEGLVLSLDGATISMPLSETGIPLDAGNHTFVATATGRKTWTRTFTVRALGDVHHIDVALVEDAVSPAITVEKRDDAPTPTSTSTRGTRTLGYVVGGVSVVAFGVGAAFGIVALKKTHDYKDVCPGGACADSTGITLHDDAKRAATLSTIGLGVGVAGIAVGTYFLLSSARSSDSSTTASSSSSSSDPPSAKVTAMRAAPMVSPSTLGLVVGGAF